MDESKIITTAAQLLAEPVRVKILQLLEEGALSVNELATRLGVAQPRISSHLAILRDVGWVFVIVEGRQRRYSIAHPEVTLAMDALLATMMHHHADPEDAQGQVGEQEKDRQLRLARTCYDHLGGIVGVTLYDLFLQNGWLVPALNSIGKHQPSYTLTAVGQEQLQIRGVQIDDATKRQRRFAYACPDWTEGRFHIGGLLGVALLQRLEEIGIARQVEGSRVVEISGDIRQWLAS